MTYYEVSSGQVSSGIILSDGDGMWVYDGGTADTTTVDSAGAFYIFSGGAADKTVVNIGGQMIINSGASATGIKENGGYVEAVDIDAVIFIANTFSSSILNDVSVTVHSGTTAVSTTVNSNSILEIFDGGKADTVILNLGGRMTVSSGGTAAGIRENGGNVQVDEGADVSFAANTFSGLVPECTVA